MPVTVRIPTPLQGYTGGREEVAASAGTVVEVMRELDTRYPGLARRILDSGEIRGYLNVYLNEVDVRALQAGQTLVRDGDEVIIIPAIAGGAAVVRRAS